MLRGLEIIEVGPGVVSLTGSSPLEKGVRETPRSVIFPPFSFPKQPRHYQASLNSFIENKGSSGVAVYLHDVYSPPDNFVTGVLKANSVGFWVLGNVITDVFYPDATRNIANLAKLVHTTLAPNGLALFADYTHDLPTHSQLAAYWGERMQALIHEVEHPSLSRNDPRKVEITLEALRNLGILDKTLEASLIRQGNDPLCPTFWVLYQKVK